MSPNRFARTVASDVRRAVAGAQEAGRHVADWLPTRPAVTAQPSAKLARDKYRQQAARYDRVTAAGDPYRRHAVAALSPGPGDVVVDVGCGTGLNFAPIVAAIGPEGRLIGIDPSPDMLAMARARIADRGWHNVRLISARAEEADIGTRADAVLFCATHDVMRSPQALEGILEQAREGARVVAAGPKWAPWWAPGAHALNAAAWYLNRRYVTTFEGFGRPWSHLRALVPDLHVEPLFFGGGYLASGTVRRG